LKNLAIIPVRKGSIRVKNKGVRPFAGSSLLEIKIKQLLDCSLIHEVMVGTNDPIAKSIAKKYPVIIADRSERVCDEKLSTANDMIFDLASRADSSVTNIVWAHCTNPLIDEKIYDEAIDIFIKGQSMTMFDSLVSASELRSHVWQDYEPLNFNPYGDRHPLASELEPYCYQNGGIFIQPRKQMVDNKYFYGQNPHLFLIDEYDAIDIDTPKDFKIAELLYEDKYGNAR
jgi:CMP-N-acetylneuraminic acid synthetase|tara:strand:+ start:4624 stop:5310 length:687 start_codon:yes stop_codon:yes gene_type:complete